jgi:aspartate kinase
MRIVEKYGGTSVGDVDRIKNVASRVKRSYDEGHQMVVIVSARSGVTNELIARAKAITPHPDEREMDTLMACGEQETIALTTMALHAIGIPAVSRTGPRAGFRTDGDHMRARIQDITGGDIPGLLDEGKVVVVAGFQGLSPDGEITTMGRGGSDLSAIALAKGVNADLCRINTDVDGVYTADPRIVPDARKLHEIHYEEMLELASSGSKVMQSRAVEFASKFKIPFEVRSSFNDNPGTIVKEVASMEDIMVNGVAVDKNQTRIGVSKVPDRPGAAAKVFNSLADEGVNVDMIVQNVGRDGYANISFTVPKDDTYKAEKALAKALEDVPGATSKSMGDIAKVSVVGLGMRSHSGVAAKLFDALAKAGINIGMITTSEIKISVALDLKDADEAVRVAHKAFDLGEER